MGHSDETETALLEAVAATGGSVADKFAKRALKTLQKNKVLPVSDEMYPTKVPHGGGVSQATLRASHNTPSGA